MTTFSISFHESFSLFPANTISTLHLMFSPYAKMKDTELMLNQSVARSLPCVPVSMRLRANESVTGDG